MSQRKIISAITAVVLGCTLLAQAAGAVGSGGAARQAGDEAALRDLVRRYFAAFARKDLSAVTALWSAQSPDYVPTRNAITGLFEGARSIAVNELNVLRVTFTADGARSRGR